MHPTSTHPSWCEYPQATNDATHTHTAAIGTAYLTRDVTIELVLAQTPDSSQPMLALHVTAPTARLSVDITGAQAWALAGVLIDATVTHARAVPHGQQAVEPPEPARPTPTQRTGARPRPIWLLDRHPNGRMPGLRAGRRSFQRPPSHRPDSRDDQPGDQTRSEQLPPPQ